MRDELKSMLSACMKCKAHLEANVSMILGDDGVLTDGQVVAVVTEMKKIHVGH